MPDLAPFAFESWEKLAVIAAVVRSRAGLYRLGGFASNALKYRLALIIRCCRRSGLL